MAQTNYDEVPEKIRLQLDSLLQEAGLPVDALSREKLATVWLEKYRMFSGQVAALGMELVPELSFDDPRGAILLTYSGSLISFGTLNSGTRWLEYASIKFRTDVPELVLGDKATLSSSIKQDAVAQFGGCALKSTSSLYKIAVCPQGTGIDDQERRIREATIFLTNGFVKLNRSVASIEKSDVDQFTLKSMVNYVARKNDVTQVKARSIIDDFFMTIECGILLGEKVPLGKLGSAKLKLNAARKARVMKNLRTGEDLLVPAKPECLAPKFSFATAFKEKSGRLEPSLMAGDDDSQDSGDDD
jgi:nucleoid DNA-binding protein